MDARVHAAGSVASVIYACSGGKFRVRLRDKRARAGHREGEVVDTDGNVVGWASDYIYGGSGFAVSTGPFGGYVSIDQVEFVS